MKQALHIFIPTLTPKKINPNMNIRQSLLGLKTIFPVLMENTLLRKDHLVGTDPLP